MLRENVIPFPSFPNILLSHNLHCERFPKSGLFKASGIRLQRFYLPSNIYLLSPITYEADSEPIFQSKSSYFCSRRWNDLEFLKNHYIKLPTLFDFFSSSSPKIPQDVLCLRLWHQFSKMWQTYSYQGNSSLATRNLLTTLSTEPTSFPNHVASVFTPLFSSFSLQQLYKRVIREQNPALWWMWTLV